MDSADNLLVRFAQIIRHPEAVQLLNTYRGIPVMYPATVNNVDHGYVTLEVHQYQAACMALENQTYVLAEVLQQPLHARVISVDFLRSRVILTEFSPASQSVGKRLTMRVQPKAPLEAEILDGEHRFPGKLADISTSGAGLAFSTHVYENVKWSKGQQMFVDLHLPGSANPPEADQVVRLRAKITSLVQQSGTPQQRVGMTIHPDPPAEAKLRSYISARQAEIMAELKRVYDSMCRKHGIEDQAR
jgi:hypothetical protein